MYRRNAIIGAPDMLGQNGITFLLLLAILSMRFIDKIYITL